MPTSSILIGPARLPRLRPYLPKIALIIHFNIITLSMSVFITGPTKYRDLPRYHLSRLFNWTLPRRFFESLAIVRQQDLAPPFGKLGEFVSSERGCRLEHTSVTSAQVEMLLNAVRASKHLSAPIIEIGSFRGVTTRSLALEAGPEKEVIAVDPYLGEGGHDKDFGYFRQHTSDLPNVRHIKATSDHGFKLWGNAPVSMVFIDAMHEYLHAQYDFEAWGSLIEPGGFVAFHDVDQFPGVNLLCQKILTKRPEWRPWAYAPNIAIFQRRSTPQG